MHSRLKLNHELWDVFTRKEEYHYNKLDAHNRFTYAFSNYKSVLEPVVSKYLIAEQFLQVAYPNNKEFAICLTHDVDDIYPPLSHRLISYAYCMKNLDFRNMLNQISWKWKGREDSPYFNFREIMKLEEKFNAKSTFYFIVSDRDPIRFRYSIGDIDSELKFIKDQGWEVGLHGGYYTYNNLNEIIKEKRILEEALDKEIKGYRNHYLRFEVPETWNLLERAGFKYDTTFGYSDAVGFRNGMCHPYLPWDLNTNTEIDILEIPLIIMDGALFSVANSFNDAWEITKRLIDTVASCHGVLTLLWHNNVFNFPLKNKWKLLYQKVLEYGHLKNAWMTSAEEIWKWWKYDCQNC